MPEMQTAEAALKTLRLVVIAMIVGVVTLCGVVLSLGDTVPDQPELLNTLQTALLIGAVVATLLPMVLYRPMLRRAARAIAGAADQTDRENRAAGAFFSYTLVCAALGEALGLFSGAVYLITRYPSALLLAGLGLILIARRFPSRAQLERFVTDAEQTAAEPPGP